MSEKISRDDRVLMHRMLQGLRGKPVVPLHVANAAFAIMCLALTKMDPNERDRLLATLDAAARSQVTSLLQKADEGGGLKWVH